jgi:hypothetical protein
VKPVEWHTIIPVKTSGLRISRRLLQLPTSTNAAVVEFALELLSLNLVADDNNIVLLLF